VFSTTANVASAVLSLLIGSESNVTDFFEREDDWIAVSTATSASAGPEILADSDDECLISDYNRPV